MPRTLVAAALCALGLAAVPAADAATPLPGFRSPSRNIACLYMPNGPAHLLCSIAHSAYNRKLDAHCAAPPIELDWGGFELGPVRKGTIVCTGGILYDPATQRPTYVTLQYGKTWRHGQFTCVSRVTGVTCRNRQGHRLFLSRPSWRAW